MCEIRQMRMHRKLVCCALRLTLVVAACHCGGASVCDRADAVSSRFSAKVGTCVGASQWLRQATFTSSACQNALSRCSDNDQRSLGAQLDCLDSLPACVPGQEMEYSAVFRPCLFTGTAISSTCTSALTPP